MFSKRENQGKWMVYDEYAMRFIAVCLIESDADNIVNALNLMVQNA